MQFYKGKKEKDGRFQYCRQLRWVLERHTRKSSPRFALLIRTLVVILLECFVCLSFGTLLEPQQQQICPFHVRQSLYTQQNVWSCTSRMLSPLQLRAIEDYLGKKANTQTFHNYAASTFELPIYSNLRCTPLATNACRFSNF